MALFQLSPYEIKEIKGSLPRYTGLLQLSSEHPGWSSSLILYPGYTAANLSSVPSSNDRRFNEDFKWNITDSGSLTILFNLTMLNNQVMFNFHITGYQYFETSASDSRSLRFLICYHSNINNHVLVGSFKRYVVKTDSHTAIPLQVDFIPYLYTRCCKINQG